jgi:hypothetical protein
LKPRNGIDSAESSCLRLRLRQDKSAMGILFSDYSWPLICAP